MRGGLYWRVDEVLAVGWTSGKLGKDFHGIEANLNMSFEKADVKKKVWGVGN